MEKSSEYSYACEFARRGCHDATALWLRKAADKGYQKAIDILSLASPDTSDERLFVELRIAMHEDARKIESSKLEYPERARHDRRQAGKLLFEKQDEWNTDDDQYSCGGELTDAQRAMLLASLPQGSVIPPASGREAVRTPNLTSANPSFAARLIVFVRDRFGGDAPSVYRAAHVSRKTYSSIVSNELRPVSKQTAIAFALALHLTWTEACDLLKSAGFAFSEFMLEDIAVRACIMVGIYDIDRINSILSAHGAKTFPCCED